MHDAYTETDCHFNIYEIIVQGLWRNTKIMEVITNDKKPGNEGECYRVAEYTAAKLFK